MKPIGLIYVSRLQITTAPTTQWTHLSRRRLQTYPSKLTAENAMIEKALPNWLVGPVIPRLRSIPVAADDEARTSHVFSSSPHEAPNHVLVNLYEPGQGIMPHEDGAAYWPVVSTVSLGSAIVLDVYEKREDGSRREEASYRILQEPRRLGNGLRRVQARSGSMFGSALTARQSAGHRGRPLRPFPSRHRGDDTR